MNRLMNPIVIQRVSNGWIVSPAYDHERSVNCISHNAEVATTPKQLGALVEAWAEEQDKAKKEAAKAEARKA